jgi:hypothetical protein
MRFCRQEKSPFHYECHRAAVLAWFPCVLAGLRMGTIRIASGLSVIVPRTEEAWRIFRLTVTSDS